MCEESRAEQHGKFKKRDICPLNRRPYFWTPKGPLDGDDPHPPFLTKNVWPVLYVIPDNVESHSDGAYYHD